MSSRAQEKAQRKAEREALQAKQQATEQRRKRLTILGGVLALAAAVVGIAIVVSQSGTDTGPGTSAEGKAAAALVEGIDQRGLVLGVAKAPLTIQEYVDFQCPNCHEYNKQSFPTVLDRYVRTGKVRLELKTMAFLGEGSTIGARYAQAAAKQNRVWQFTEAFFTTAGEENSGYVTDEFLRARAADAGLDFARLQRDADSADARTAADDVEAEAGRFGVTGTPSFVMGKTGGKLERVDISNPFDPAAVTAAIDAQLKAIGEEPPK